MPKKVDAVFEGGGVKGIGLVGAVSEIEKAGYQFENLAGTSAGCDSGRFARRRLQRLPRSSGRWRGSITTSSRMRGCWTSWD